MRRETSSTTSAAVLVMGMHRSGTSATSGALLALGVNLGGRLYEGHADVNAKGYFEHVASADIDEEVLALAGATWDDPRRLPDDAWAAPGLDHYRRKLERVLRKDFQPHAVSAIKDPRICRMLPFWLPALKAVGMQPFQLFVMRSPLAVARSLARRDGFSAEKAAILWLRHYLEAELAGRSLPRAFMSFEGLLADPVAAFERAQRQLGLAFPKSPTDAAPALAAFVTKDLQHHAPGGSDAPHGPWMQLALDAQECMLRACSGDATEPDPATLAGLHDRMRALEQDWPPVLLEHIGAVGARSGRGYVTLERLVRSWSWYAGKPIRALERAIGRDV